MVGASRAWQVRRVTVVVASAAYVGAVFGAVTLLGAVLGPPLGLGRPAPLATAVATAIIAALTLDRVDAWLRRRLDVTTQGPLQRHVASLSRADDVSTIAHRTARVLAEGTAATSAEVWLANDGTESRAAAWPEPAAAGTPAGVVIPVHWGGARIGSLRLLLPPGTTELAPVEVRLVDELATQAGLALHQFRLDADLRRRVEEHEASIRLLGITRQRVVEAADAERRRIERDIHDGAQQHLLALAVGLRLAATLAGRDPGRARRALAAADDIAGQAMADLDALSVGLRPAALDTLGVTGALRQAAHGSLVPLVIEDTHSGHWSPQVATAVYFGCLEAVQNAAKHARASTIHVRLESDERCVRFIVHDDGVGLPRPLLRDAGGPRGPAAGIAQRLAALDGRVTVESTPGFGTTVVGEVPLRAGVAP
jgi:signal transduction histidine kinase